MASQRKLKDVILKLKNEGKTQTEIRNIIGCSLDTVRYHFNPEYAKYKSQDRNRRRKDVKLKLVSEMGGKCQICGYNKCPAALQFHHKNPEEKEFSISGYTINLNKLRDEAKKCILLCANCHAEVEFNGPIEYLMNSPLSQSGKGGE